MLYRCYNSNPLEPPPTACLLLTCARLTDLRFAPVIGRTISHYRMTEKLGGGGMSVLYKAAEKRLRRKQAISSTEIKHGGPI